MYKKELDAKLNKNEVIKGVLLYGADSFLIGYYGEKIAKVHLKNNCEKHCYYFSEFNLDDALACFSQGSLFGESSLVWIKIDKKLSKKQLDSLVKNLLNSNGFLIIEFYQADNKSDGEYAYDARSMAASFPANLAKNGVFEVRFFEISSYEALGILREYASELKIQITDFLLQKILEQQNFDLGLSIAELRKYSIFKQEITGDLIASVGYGLGSVEVDEILESLLNKKPYLKKLEQFLEQNTEEMPLISSVHKYFLVLFLFYSHIKTQGDNDLKSVLGYNLPPQLMAQKKQFAMRLNEAQYEQIFFILNEWREESVSGINKGNRFLSTLIKIQAILR